MKVEREKEKLSGKRNIIGLLAADFLMTAAAMG